MFTPEACIKLFLEALEYPKREEYDVTQPQHNHHLINWLENTKIRHYPVEDRAPLKSQVASEFNAAVQKYSDELCCPHSWGDGTNVQPAIQWILQYAVGLEYSDNVDVYNEALDKLVEETVPLEEWQPPPPPPFPDINSPQVRQIAADIRSKLGLQTPEDMPLKDAIDEITDRVENQINPMLSLVEEYGGRVPTVGELLRHFPLGFTTGSEKLDEAATVLRVLHVQELRELQTKIDHAIEEMQALTANPKTIAGPAKGKRKADQS